MRKLRLLVVDDAVVVRSLLVKLFSGDPQLEPVGVAATGRIALALLTQMDIDLVLLDIDMPDMDGMETLALIRARHPKVAVMMFSALTERGAQVALDALALGAVDYFTKPTNLGNSTPVMQHLRDELLPRIKAVCADRLAEEPREARAPLVATPAPRPQVAAAATPAARAFPTPPCPGVDLVAIGTSTGGPNALADLFPALPADFPVPILVVQHMPPIFTRLLAERLSQRSGLRVVEASEGVVPQPGWAYVAPGNFHLTVIRPEGAPRPVLHLHQGPPEHSCRPAVDVLLRSVAQLYPGRALAVVLTGMGQDGALGCHAIRETGGQVLAQDAATSVVWGMPGAVVAQGLADKVLPLSRVAPEIVRRASEGRGRARSPVEP